MDDDERAVYDARFQALQDQIDALTRAVQTLTSAVEYLRADRDGENPDGGGGVR